MRSSAQALNLLSPCLFDDTPFTPLTRRQTPLVPDVVRFVDSPAKHPTPGTS